jgi:hypothetical protein
MALPDTGRVKVPRDTSAVADPGVGRYLTVQIASVTVTAVVIVTATPMISTGRNKGRQVFAPLMPVDAKDRGVPGTPTIIGRCE